MRSTSIMNTLMGVIPAHPIGETKSGVRNAGNSWPVDTPGGRFYAEGDTEAPVTREGQLIFFFSSCMAGGQWEQITGSISPVLGLLRILDIAATVKPIYGRQQGAQIGYNAQKPGRPNHVCHSYFVANLRLSLGEEVAPRNAG